MTTRLSHSWVDSVQERIRSIREQVTNLPGPANVLQEAVEDLSALVEEVRAAQGELAQTQAMAAADHTRYHEFFDLAPDAYVITDTRGVVIEANRAASLLLRSRAGGLAGESLVAVVAPSDEPLFRERLAALRQSRTREPVAWQLWLQPAGASPFPVSVTASALVDEQTPQIRWLLRDMTARYYAEQAAVESLRVAQDAFERERLIAAKFQSALLPPGDPRIPGYVLAHSYRPALAEAEVGGDFYNFFALDAARTALVVGDVGGKGLAAAATAAFAQHTLMALAMQKGMLPTLLDAVRPLVAAFNPDQIVTLFFAVLRAETGTLRWVSAGHEPALIWRAAEQRVDRLSAGESAIFALPVAPYVTRRTALAPGDLLFLYTDGLREARAPRSREILGEERIVEILTRNHAAHPTEILHAMYDAALDQSQGHIRDDIVLVALRRATSAGECETVRVQPPQMEDRLAGAGR